MMIDPSRTLTHEVDIDPVLDLVLERVVSLSPEEIWEAWTMPAHLKVWFCPRPWRVTDAEVDLRPGGIFRTVFQGPDGETFPNVGSFLELVPCRKLVFTDAFLPDYKPAPNPFMTGILLLTPESSGTRYTAIARHADEGARRKHETMGFHTGWGTALDQLVEHMGGQRR